MLKSNRFTIVVTKDCQARLEDAQSNRRPIAQGEQHRGAVTAIQSALADLNCGYFSVAEVDGFFGMRTYNAVEAFQRDYGLIADGSVGKQTIAQLDAIYSSDVVRRPYGKSIHVGVNCLDTAHYGDKFELTSCVNDANKMQEIAESIGYDTVILENEEATVSNFTNSMRSAISDLYDGDSLLITFSGHGSQIPNNSIDEEDDMLDETLCFFDRMLIDDELYALFSQLRDGVRVHAVFDSCHSGTVAKRLNIVTEKESRDAYLSEIKKQLALSDKEKSLTEEYLSDRPISTKNLLKALDGEKPDLEELPKLGKEQSEEIASLFADLYSDVTSGKSKSIDFFSDIYDRNKDIYDAIKNVVGAREDQYLSCSVIALSACHDSQTTPAGALYSLFTYNIMTAWRTNSTGSYRQFHRNLLNTSRADATPQINTYGARAGARLYDRPFVF